MIERASLRNKCKVLCFWASKLLKEREFGGKMQNIGLEMRKCVAGGQKMGLQAPNTTIARESGRTFDEGGRKVSTKEAAHSEKAGATRSQLDLSRRKVGAHSARGQEGFPKRGGALGESGGDSFSTRPFAQKSGRTFGEGREGFHKRGGALGESGGELSEKGQKSAALHGGVRREGWFCGDRRRSA